jgi:hypothetical protein
VGAAGSSAPRQGRRDLPRDLHAAATGGVSSERKFTATPRERFVLAAPSMHFMSSYGGCNMTRLITVLCAWLCAMAFVTATNPAKATGVPVAYVSNTGSNTGDCSTPATACQSFAYALSQIENYGEIDCVNTGAYLYIFTITQSVTIDCAGTVGRTGGVITINGPGIVVRLRNLSLDANGFGQFGVDVKNAAALYVENCVITNYNAANFSMAPYIGINFAPSANAQLFVSNSIIGNNGNSATSLSGGIYINPASGMTATVLINRSEINGNFFGIVGDGRTGGIIKGTIKDSVVSGNTENGVTAISSGSSILFVLDQTDVSANAAAGLFASGSGAGILARNTTVFDNGIGLDAASGAGLISYGNNSVAGNTTNGAFTATVSQQ